MTIFTVKSTILYVRNMKDSIVHKLFSCVYIALFFAIIIFNSCTTTGTKSRSPNKITVAAYYFPNYHAGDPRNAIQKDKNWSEWELVKAAQPRFPGHHQPNAPDWGYVDEKDPKVMEMKIKAAVENGIDCFIFDWYMYEDGPFLNRCIDEGFLKAKNTESIQFAFM